MQLLLSWVLLQLPKFNKFRPSKEEVTNIKDLSLLRSRTPTVTHPRTLPIAKTRLFNLNLPPDSTHGWFTTTQSHQRKSHTQLGWTALADTTLIRETFQIDSRARPTILL